MRLLYTPEFMLDPIAEDLASRDWDVGHSDNPGADLVEGKADIVITPALDYGRHLGMVDYALIPGFGVTAGGFAGVMKIVFNAGLETIDRLAVRDASHASVIIAQMLLVEKHGIEPDLVEVSGDADLSVMLEVADGALLSGDDALFSPASLTQVLDLADEWEDVNETFLPYALAWGREGIVPQPVIDEFLAARDQAVLTLADRSVGHTHQAEAAEFYQRYLKGDIRYALTETEATDVLNPLFHYAFYHGIINDIPSIKFLPIEPAEETPGTEGNA